MQNIATYLAQIIKDYATGQAREHAHRPTFKKLIENINPDLTHVLNDPARSVHGNPDFVFLRGDLTAGYAETKDIGVDLDKIEKTEQLERYFGYSNLILTNYLEFRFFRNGEQYGDSVVVGILDHGIIIPQENNYELLERTVKDFLQSKPEQIRSGARLAKIMGGKARRIRENVSRYLVDTLEKSEELRNVYEVMKRLLVHDLSIEAFADMYAQTLVYGLFVARYHDDSLTSFSRQEARDLVPDSNPLLRHFFDHIAGANFDKRLGFIVDELCEVFSAADVRKIMGQYRSSLWGTMKWGEDKWAQPDPVIHFYEDFLKEYDPDQRVKLGAFYTPLPVVRFIVRSVDTLLKREFGLKAGLADTTKIEVPVIVQGKKRKELIHRVQILDPAVGTGTFLNETTRFIHQSFEEQGGRWVGYVDDELLPRLHGFELMMAPYTIAHLKLGMTLRDMGYEKFSRRLGVYLTNSLEKGVTLDGTLFESLGFMHSITEEAREASKIKNEKPIMVVLGNPPYSISSSNKGQWILDLIKDYKKNLNEKKINLDDDYIKFIRFSEHFIEKNGAGIVAMITNNSFVDGITHRQMRKHLLETFDDIYILDLHGNMKKKETALDGSKDENVFDIQQGVSINIFVRTSKSKKKLGAVHHAELFGLRKEKYEKLNESDVETIEWKNLVYVEPYYFFVPKDFSVSKEYEKGFKIDELFPVSNSGVKTDRDSLFVDIDKVVLESRMQKLLSGDYDEKFKKDYRVVDSGSYKLTQKLKEKIFDELYIQMIQYRPFDYRWIYYDPALISRPGDKVFKHVVGHENTGFLICRQQSTFDFQHILASNLLSDICSVSLQTKETGYFFPLYLYHKDGSKIANLKGEIVEKIKANVSGEVTPEDILNYIYAALYSPKYREVYKEFLKIDFPRIPYPKDEASFRRLVSHGRELRVLHLLESSMLQVFATTFPESGSGMVEKISYKEGKVFINETQYFGNVPEVAWNFYIGGYQPAQKWLKDRKGRVLSNADLEHYQKTIVALKETDRIMKEIDLVLES